MNIDEFAEFIFLKNKDNVKVQFDVDGLDTPKDLFLFFIDLTTKGMIYLYGKNDFSVDLISITEEHFENIKKCLELVGIYVYLDIEDNIYNISSGLNSQEISNYPDNDNLSNYIFKIYSGDYLYKIKFDVKF
jgi:hypothetical protein